MVKSFATNIFCCYLDGGSGSWTLLVRERGRALTTGVFDDVGVAARSLRCRTGTGVLAGSEESAKCDCVGAAGAGDIFGAGTILEAARSRRLSTVLMFQSLRLASM